MVSVVTRPRSSLAGCSSAATGLVVNKERHGDRDKRLYYSFFPRRVFLTNAQQLYFSKHTDAHTLSPIYTHNILYTISISIYPMFLYAEYTHFDRTGAGRGHPASPPARPWFLWWRRWCEIRLVRGWWWTDSWISVLLTPSPSHGSGCPLKKTKQHW